jgi:glycosyltransferase involved in cell wall biosynthesis
VGDKMENDIGLVSIIMPAYNAVDTIMRAIKSVINQSYDKWELIIVDDGSKDATSDAVNAFDDMRIKCVRQKNAGPAAARNRGLELATGEYIAFIDADDMIHRNYLERLVEMLEENDADIAMCSYKKVTIRNQEDYKRLLSQATEVCDWAGVMVMSSEDCINRMFYKNLIMPYPFLKVFKRSAIGSVRFPEQLRLGEDLEFNLNVMRTCTRVAVSEDVMYFHIENMDSITHDLNYDVAEKHFDQLLKMLEQESCQYKHAIENRLFVVSYDFLCQADKKEIKEKTLFFKCKDFIKKHCISVYGNVESTKVVKIMAGFSRLSIPFTIMLCRQGKKIVMKKAV